VLVYLGQWVARGSRWPGRGGIEDRETPVPLCRCPVCKKRSRVLPVEIAPHKSYTRPVIETACATYASAKRPGVSLRQTVRLMGAGHPDASLLHGWLGGLGARALGRLDRHRQGPPVGALISESAKCLRGDLLTDWTQPPTVAPRKYRSLQRQDRLEACARLFGAAGRLFPEAAYPFSAWEAWLHARFHVTAWGFPARLSGTAIQHHAPRRRFVGYAPSRPRRFRRKDGKVHGARSPP
jgi:hypothetical protein